MAKGKEANFLLFIQYCNLNIQYWTLTTSCKEQLFFLSALRSFASELYQTPQLLLPIPWGMLN